MLRQRSYLMLILVVFCSISICFGIGCAKKGKAKDEATEPGIKEEPVKSEEVEPVQPPSSDETGVLEPTGKAFDMIYFDFDMYNLKDEARAILDLTIEDMKANPDTKVSIEGHCDERGTIEYNLQLGNKRAASAKDYIVTSGIDASRLKTISYGEEKPIATGQDEESWAKNRRDEFKIIN